MKKSAIVIKVMALNLLNQYSQLICDYERKFYAQFIGMDIFKVDGSLKAKYTHDKLDDNFKGTLPDGTFFSVMYWFDNSYHSFKIHVKICINGGSYETKPNTAFCQYEEKCIYAFDVEAINNPLKGMGYTFNALKEVEKPDFDYSTRYDADALLLIAADIKAAAKAYEAIEDKMPHYFREVLGIERLAR